MGMPRKVAERILRKIEEEGVAVVVGRDGTPTRVFGYHEYQRMKDLPRSVKPWTKKRKESPDPLGAVDGTVLQSLRRTEIYD